LDGFELLLAEINLLVLDLFQKLALDPHLSCVYITIAYIDADVVAVLT
jgi:hypothetical protein